MLSKVVDIINGSSSIKIEENILLCTYEVTNLKIIKELYDSHIIENSLVDNYEINETVELEFSIASLLPQGFYVTVESFLKWNYYSFPDQEIYIYELRSYLNKSDVFERKYSSVVKLISEFTTISKYCYYEEEVLNSIIVREDKSLVLSLKYSNDDLNSINENTIILIDSFIEILTSDMSTDKKNIYLNELIDFLNKKGESDRFSYLLKNFENYISTAASTFNFYLRNFSFNKLKVELDAKALEFYQKLQGVINDSQAKLIAIPTALVFVFSTFDYENINSLKNYLTLVGLIMFCIFIQIFINNQKSAISFIEENINYYKLSYNNDISELQKSFEKVYKERDKQLKRIQQIQLLLWLLPILTVSVIMFLNAFKLASFLVLLVYVILGLMWYFYKFKLVGSI
ncbi:hypothetical protein [Kaistella sp.]|uniref:hypothetical protein n=1 Tax=Kaistella sp. TaxID=2782235 RepID=UPI002F940B39